MEAIIENEKKPGIAKLFQCKCPRCRKGDMFVVKNPYRLKTTMKMNDACSVCGQDFNIEVGFYYGTNYVSYAFAVALSAVTLVLWWLTIGLSLQDNRFFYWIAFNAFCLVALQPPLMRIARTIWLAFFVPYDKNWKINPAGKPERKNKEQEQNWR